MKSTAIRNIGAGVVSVVGALVMSGQTPFVASFNGFIHRFTPGALNGFIHFFRF